jgi:chromosome segregation ATPase
MTRTERIETLKKALAALEAAIAQTEAALRMAANPNDILRLTSQVADLKAQRQSLRFQLANLEAAEGEIMALSPESTERLKVLAGDMDKAILDRTVAAATIDTVNDLLGKVSEIRKTLG